MRVWKEIYRMRCFSHERSGTQDERSRPTTAWYGSASPRAPTSRSGGTSTFVIRTVMYTQRTLIRVERASSVLKSCIPIGQFLCKVNGNTRIDQWDYRILKLRGHVRHESMSTGCTIRLKKKKIKKLALIFAIYLYNMRSLYKKKKEL